MSKTNPTLPTIVDLHYIAENSPVVFPNLLEKTKACPVVYYYFGSLEHMNRFATASWADKTPVGVQWLVFSGDDGILDPEIRATASTCDKDKGELTMALGYLQAKDGDLFLRHTAVSKTSINVDYPTSSKFKLNVVKSLSDTPPQQSD